MAPRARARVPGVDQDGGSVAEAQGSFGSGAAGVVLDREGAVASDHRSFSDLERSTFFLTMLAPTAAATTKSHFFI